MTKEKLEAIKARCEKATPGPWRLSWLSDWLSVPKYAVVVANGVVGSETDDHDAELIAHAREDIPALIAEVERLQERVRTLWYALTGTPAEDG